MKRNINAVDRERGQRLRDLRVQRHWYQQTVADKVAEITGKATKSAVSAWETGVNPPGRETLFALDTVFGGTGEVLEIYGETRGAAIDRVEARLDQLVAQLDGVAEVVAENRDNLLTLLETLRLLARERREDDEAARRTAAGQ